MFALKMKFLSFGHLRSLFCSERETFKRQHAGYFPHFFFLYSEASTGKLRLAMVASSAGELKQ